MHIRSTMACLTPIFLLALAVPASAQWADGFESYAPGSPIEGQGGWDSWTGTTTYPYNTVDAGLAFSGVQSLRVVGSVSGCAGCSDTVYEFSPAITTGVWKLSVQQYVPSGFSGQSYLILLNDFGQPAGPYDWSAQVSVNSATSTFTVDPQGTGTVHNGPQPIGYDRWVPIELEIDLTANIIRIYYDGVLMNDYVYTTGIVAIDTLDLFPATDATTAVFYDDFRLQRVPAPWTDGFESYAAGTPIEGQGGWDSWTGTATYPYNAVDASQAFSGAHSLRVAGSVSGCAGCSDTVYEFPTAITTGVWALSVWQYVPSGFSGQSYFILLNDFGQPAGPYDWSAQVSVNSATSTFTVDPQGTGTVHNGPQPIGYDRWVPIELEIDLTANIIRIYYDGVLMNDYVYTTGIVAIDTLDLFPATDATTAVYYDDFSLERRDTVGTRFCTAEPNSIDRFASITGFGSSTASANNLTLQVDGLPLNSNGFFLTSQNRGIVVMPGNTGGNICIASPAIGRYDTSVLNSGTTGSVSLALHLPTTPLQPGGPVAVMSGDTWYWQYWYRDVVGGITTSNFSTALCVEFE